MTKLLEVLKKEGIRLSNGDKWMVWNQGISTWEVYERLFYKGVRNICQSSDLNIALEILNKD